MNIRQRVEPKDKPPSLADSSIPGFDKIKIRRLNIEDYCLDRQTSTDQSSSSSLPPLVSSDPNVKFHVDLPTTTVTTSSNSQQQQQELSYIQQYQKQMVLFGLTGDEFFTKNNNNQSSGNNDLPSPVFSRASIFTMSSVNVSNSNPSLKFSVNNNNLRLTKLTNSSDDEDRDEHEANWRQKLRGSVRFTTTRNTNLLPSSKKNRSHQEEEIDFDDHHSDNDMMMLRGRNLVGNQGKKKQVFEATKEKSEEMDFSTSPDDEQQKPEVAEGRRSSLAMAMNMIHQEKQQNHHHHNNNDTNNMMSSAMMNAESFPFVSQMTTDDFSSRFLPTSSTSSSNRSSLNYHQENQGKFSRLPSTFEMFTNDDDNNTHQQQQPTSVSSSSSSSASSYVSSFVEVKGIQNRFTTLVRDSSSSNQQQADQYRLAPPPQLFPPSSSRTQPQQEEATKRLFATTNNNNYNISRISSLANLSTSNTIHNNNNNTISNNNNTNHANREELYKKKNLIIPVNPINKDICHLAVVDLRRNENPGNAINLKKMIQRNFSALSSSSTAFSTALDVENLKQRKSLPRIVNNINNQVVKFESLTNQEDSLTLRIVEFFPSPATNSPSQVFVAKEEQNLHHNQHHQPSSSSVLLVHIFKFASAAADDESSIFHYVTIFHDVTIRTQLGLQLCGRGPFLGVRGFAYLDGIVTIVQTGIALNTTNESFLPASRILSSSSSSSSSSWTKILAIALNVCRRLAEGRVSHGGHLSLDKIFISRDSNNNNDQITPTTVVPICWENLVDHKMFEKGQDKGICAILDNNLEITILTDTINILSEFLTWYDSSSQDPNNNFAILQQVRSLLQNLEMKRRERNSPMAAINLAIEIGNIERKLPSFC